MGYRTGHRMPTAGRTVHRRFRPAGGAPESCRRVPFTAGRWAAVPSAPVVMVPPLQGLAAPLPSAGVPGAPASDQIVGGAGLPGGSPDLTGAAPLGAAALVGPPFAAPDGATGSSGFGMAPVSAAPFAPVGGSCRHPRCRRCRPFRVSTGGDRAVRDAVPSGAGGGAGDQRPAVDPPVGLPVGVRRRWDPVVAEPPVPVPDAPAPVPTPSSPYYFIAESSPYRGGSDGGLDTWWVLRSTRQR